MARVIKVCCRAAAAAQFNLCEGWRAVADGPTLCTRPRTSRAVQITPRCSMSERRACAMRSELHVRLVRRPLLRYLPAVCLSWRLARRGEGGAAWARGADRRRVDRRRPVNDEVSGNVRVNVNVRRQTAGGRTAACTCECECECECEYECGCEGECESPRGRGAPMTTSDRHEPSCRRPHRSLSAPSHSPRPPRRSPP